MWRGVWGALLTRAQLPPPKPAEVVEYAAGIARDLMGEYVEGVSAGIDTYSLRQPLGVAAGICPFNFPGTRAGSGLCCLLCLPAL